MAVIEPGTEAEQRLLARWIKRGEDLIVGTSAMGASYLDPNVKRGEEVQKLTEAAKADCQAWSQIIVALNTGLRSGEMRALQWKHLPRSAK